MKDYSSIASVDQRLRDRVTYLILILFFYKVLSQIPVPFLPINVVTDRFTALMKLNSYQLNPIISVGLTGIAPYLYASSIIEFSTLSIPSLKKNREVGGTLWTKQMNLWKRYIATVFILASAWQKCYNLTYGLFNLNTIDTFILLSVFVSGGLFIVWMAETLSIYTLGLGSNILIFIDILSDLGRLAIFQPIKLPFGLLLFSILWGILVLTEAQRKLPLIISRFTDTKDSDVIKNRQLQTNADDYLSISLIPGGSTLSILTLGLCVFVVGVIESVPQMALKVGLTILTFLVYYFLAKSFVDFALNTEEIAKSLRKMSVSLYGVKSGPLTLRFLNQLKSVLFAIPLFGTGLLIVVPFLLSVYVKGIENSAFSFVPSVFLIYSIYNDLFYKVSAYLKIDD